MFLVKTRIGPSKIHGIGVFAEERIPKGQMIWVFDGRIDVRVPISDLPTFPPPMRAFLRKYGYEEMHEGRRTIVLCGDHARHVNHSNDANVTDGEPGAVVTIVDVAGRFVGRGLYNPRPALCCRVVTWRDEAVGDALLRRRIAVAVARRTEHGALPTLGRLVWSEADGLPGLVVDRYGPVAVVQCLTLGMALRRRDLVSALREAIGDVPVFSADEPGQATLEGFDPARTWLDEHGPDHVIVEEGAVKIGVTFGQGHKTGLYLDQRENRLRVAAHAAGCDVLDAFSYTAGFACHALVAGARRAVCLESSPEAISGAHENFKLNDVADRARIVAGNAFDEVRRLDRSGERFGLVVLDPPPFARGRDALDAAARGYK